MYTFIALSVERYYLRKSEREMMVKKGVVVWLVVILVFGTIGISFGSTEGSEILEKDGEKKESNDSFFKNIDDRSSKDVFTRAEKSGGEEEGVLGQGVVERMERMSSREYVEVVVRVTSRGFEEEDDHIHISKTSLNQVDTEKVVTSLKERSASSQYRVKEFLQGENGEVVNTFWIANAVLAEVQVGALDDLLQLEEVWKVHENFEVEIPGSGSPGPTGTTQTEVETLSEDLTWGLERIDVTGAWEGGDIWEEGFKGSGVRVAVSDTGVDLDHPDLEGKMVNVEEDDPHYPGGWIEFDDEGDIVNDSEPYFEGDHGTHVSGTVVGGNASGISIGVAPEAELMHALTLPHGTGTFSQLLAGMQWKVEPHDREGVPLHERFGGEVGDYKADVASMSWSTPGYYTGWEEPIRNMWSAGVVPVGVIGNEGEGVATTPGGVFEAIGVGASDEDDGIAGFSSGALVWDQREETPERFVKPDISAPGVEVRSALPDERWAPLDGTSMATPHVSGTVALMLEANPTLSMEDIYEALEVSAEYYEGGDNFPGEEKNTRYGHGLLNASRAVDHVSGIAVREPEDVSRDGVTLRGEVFHVPGEEVDVFFRYRKAGEEWMETEPVSVSDPMGSEVELDGLEEGTDYEYKFVGGSGGAEESTFSMQFVTHDPVEVSTLEAVDVSEESAVLRGEITEIYEEEEVSAFFRHRKGIGEWTETEVEKFSEPKKFEVMLEDIGTVRRFEYKAVVASGDHEFTGDVLGLLLAGSLEPEWDEEEEAYTVSNVWELNWMRNDLSGDYVLTEDIDAKLTRTMNGGKGWEPVGRHGWFRGTLDGRGHVIEDLYIDRPDEGWIGLIGSSGEEMEVRDIGLVGVEVSGDTRVGSLVGENRGTVSRSYVNGEIHGEITAGGVIAVNRGKLSESYMRGEVDGGSTAGGLVGSNMGGEMINSYVIGKVIGEGRRFGGLVGSNLGVVHNSFWDIETTNQTESDGGTGKTTAEMKDVATFTDLSTAGLDEPWDFANNPNDDEGEKDIWTIDEREEINDGYPFLTWQEFDQNMLTIGIEGQGSVEIKGQEVRDGWTGAFEENEDIDLIAVAADYWDFAGWEGSYEGGDEEITITMDEDKAVTAHFEEQTYTLDVTIEGEGSVDIEPEKAEYEPKAEVNLTAIAADNWYFVEWTSDTEFIEDPTDERITVEMLDDHTIRAEFEIETHVLIVNSTEGGEVIEPGEGTFEYDHGMMVDIEAEGEEHHYFVKWMGDNHTIKDPYSKTTQIEIVNDVEINAKFMEYPYFEMREIWTSQYEVMEGENLTIGYTVENTGGAEDVQMIEFIVEDEDRDEIHREIVKELSLESGEIFDGRFTWVPEKGQAGFAFLNIESEDDRGQKVVEVTEFIERYELSIVVEGNGTTNQGTGDRFLEEGKIVSLEAVTYDGWEFIEWRGDIPEEQRDRDKIIITMDEDKEIIAVFEEKDEGTDWILRIISMVFIILMIAIIVIIGGGELRKIMLDRGFFSKEEQRGREKDG